MNLKLKDLPNHHAVLLVDSDRETTGISLFEELNNISLAHKFFNHKVLDIESARSIITWALTPYNDEKIALISFNTIGVEAQNALLKILEEPKFGVKFILLTSNKANIINTVLSRVLIIENKEDTQNNRLIKEVSNFVSTQSELRMKLPFVIDIISRVEKTNGKERKDKEDLRIFILTLASELENKNIPPKYTNETLEIASYVSDPSSSGKALLEYLSLLLPVSK